MKIISLGTAVQVCEDLKIQSQNDTVKLEEAKGMVYLKGFNEGVMTAGRYAGDRVADAKPKMRQDLLESGEGIKYAEPEGRVVSRSGDECIVALTDQWCAPASTAEKAQARFRSGKLHRTRWTALTRCLASNSAQTAGGQPLQMHACHAGT